MKTHGLIIDYKFCTGCHACEVACRNEHDIALDQWGIKVYEFGPVEQKGKWEWDYLPFPTELCDLCEERRAKGEKPACVHHCLADCMEVVPIDGIPARLKALGDKAVSYVP